MKVIAPFVPTPKVVAVEMLKLAKVRSGEYVVDPGCGEGAILFVASEIFDAIAIGIEIRRDLVARCLHKILKKGLVGKVYVIHGDLFNFNYRIADVVTLYLLPSMLEILSRKLARELKEGSRIVAHDFPLPKWKPVEVVEVTSPLRKHKIYLYRVPESLPSTYSSNEP